MDEPVSNPARQIMQDVNGREFSGHQFSGKILRRKYIVEPPLDQPPLQAELPTESGYFDDFAGVTPTNTDLKAKGKGYWAGTNFDNEGLSAVRSGWVSGELGLDAGSGRSLGRGGLGAPGVLTDQHPKK